MTAASLTSGRGYMNEIGGGKDMIGAVEYAAESETGEAETITRLFARATPVFAAKQVDVYRAPVIDASPATVITHA